MVFFPPREIVAALITPGVTMDYAADIIEEHVLHRRAKGDSLIDVSNTMNQIEKRVRPNSVYVSFPADGTGSSSCPSRAPGTVHYKHTASIRVDSSADASRAPRFCFDDDATAVFDLRADAVDSASPRGDPGVCFEPRGAAPREEARTRRQRNPGSRRLRGDRR